MSKNYAKLSLKAHKKTGGKISITSKFKLKNKDDLSIAYTPGVGAVSLYVSENQKKNPNTAKEYTTKKNMVAVVSDGSAVLGLGNIGPYGAIPVMEGKAVLMKHFAGVDAFPICIHTQDVEEIIKLVKNIEPVFGGINLEDISAPRCFEIEERLKKELSIPVMHDDQWGAGTVTLSGLINSLKVVKKKAENCIVVVSGVGAAGIASIKLIKAYEPKIKIYALDSKGIISFNRTDLNKEKKDLLDTKTLEGDKDGDLSFALKDTDIFIGLSKPGILTGEMVKTMKSGAVIFALANPTPEIFPNEAKKAGAAVVATGRSDFPNQINNSIFFPGFWAGMLKRKSKDYSLELLVKAAKKIADHTKKVSAENILPSTLDKKIHKVVENFFKNN